MVFCHFDHDLEEMEFSNPFHLEELEKRIILKQKMSKLDRPFKFYKFELRNTLFISAREWSCFLFFVCFCCNFNLSDLDKLFLNCSSRQADDDAVREKLFGAFPTWQRPWIRKLCSNSATLQRANF